jgi:dienelactone hydrolase
MGRENALDRGRSEDWRSGPSRPARRPCHFLPGTLLLCLLPLAAGALQIEVRPRPALVDQRLDVRVAGLASNEEVSLRAEMTDQTGVPWVSEVVLRAGSDGTLDLARAVPVSGSYAEADAMGHIWSMVPAAVLGGTEERRRDYLRETRKSWFAVDDVTLPTAVTLTLSRQGAAPVTTSYQRLHVAPDVRIEPVHHGRLRGLLFSPAGERSPPGMLVLAGSGGGVDSQTAALLASHGYAALALAYFRYDDLPARHHRIPLEYFAEGVEWLRSELGHDGIGVWGTSRGGELALLLGSTFPDDFRVVVGNVPSSHRYPGHDPEAGSNVPAWTHQGRALSFAPLPLSWIDYLREIRQWRVLLFGAPVELTPFYLRAIADPDAAERAAIEVERIRCPLLVIGGGSDRLWPSGHFAELVEGRLEQKSSRMRHRALVYPNAGHMLRGSYRPLGLGGVIYHPEVEMFMDLGGSPRADAKAGADSWAEGLRFLRAIDWFGDPSRQTEPHRGRER